MPWIMPNHPAERARIAEENRRRGWFTVPGMMDHEQGALLTATDPTTRPYLPPLEHPEVRTVAAPGRYRPLAAALGLAGLAGLLAALVAR